MDLSTLRNKLREKIYKTPRECFDDLQLIWDNCKLFNSENSAIYAQSITMEKYARALIQSKFAELEYGKNNPSYKKLQAENENV